MQLCSFNWDTKWASTHARIERPQLTYQKITVLSVASCIAKILCFGKVKRKQKGFLGLNALLKHSKELISAQKVAGCN